MAHERRANAKALVSIDHRERNFSLFCTNYNIAPTACNYLLSILFHGSNQRHLRNEIDVQKESGFFLREIPFGHKESLIKRLLADLAYGSEETPPVIRPQCAKS